MSSPAAHIPASPGPYSNGGEVGPAGPAAVLQVQHGHFLISMSVQTTFKPSAVLPTIYALLPQCQLQCDHMDLQLDEANNKLRVQIVGVTPANNAYALSTMVQRLKALQPGATVMLKEKLSQLSVDSDSIAAFTSLLMSSQSRALLDQHIHYYRLHSHPAFVPQLLIYLDTRKLEHVLNIMRNFMADPAAGGAIKPPRPSGLEVKGDEVPSAAAAAGAPAAAAGSSGAAPPATPEKQPAPGVPPTHRGAPSSVSSRSPHFKSVGAGSSTASAAGGKGSSTLSLPSAAPMESALSANTLAATFNTNTSSKEAPTGPASTIASLSLEDKQDTAAAAQAAQGQSE